MLALILSWLFQAAAPAEAGAPAPVPAAATAAAVEQDHFFLSGGLRLHGRLYRPAGEGPFPTLLYVPGAGDPSMMTDAYARNTARAFVDRGFAMFVFDKRGIGRSGGRFRAGGIADKAADVGAALDFLATLAEVDEERIGVWAISQAGWVVPAALRGRDDVDGLILVSPAGENPVEHLQMLNRRELGRAGLSGADLDNAPALWRALMAYQGSGSGRAEAAARLAEAQDSPWHRVARATPLWEGLPGTPAELLEPEALRRAWAERPGEYEWVREEAHFADYGPQYQSIRQSVLLVYGDADTLIDPLRSRQLFEAAFRAARHPDATVRVFAGGGHGIQPRGQADTPMPDYLALITDWAASRLRR